MPLTRGIPEVPMLTTRTIVDAKGVSHKVLEDSPQLRRWMVDMRQVLVRQQEAQAPLASPTNLVVTPEAFGNLVQWTRTTGADFHEVLWNTSASLINAQVVNVGNSAQWTDNIGKSGITRYYWVRARRNSGTRSLETGPVAGTSLASGTAVTPPPPPPPGQNQVINQRTGGKTFENIP